MTLKTRLPKINKMVQSIYCVTHRGSAKRRSYTVHSPTSGKPYQVHTRWSMSVDKVLTIECGLYDYALIGNFVHPANFSKSICSQFLASMKWAANQAGKVLSLCETFTDAKRLLRFGGQLVRVTNYKGATLWATIR